MLFLLALARNVIYQKERCRKSRVGLCAINQTFWPFIMGHCEALEKNSQSQTRRKWKKATEACSSKVKKTVFMLFRPARLLGEYISTSLDGTKSHPSEHFRPMPLPTDIICTTVGWSKRVEAASWLTCLFPKEFSFLSTGTVGQVWLLLLRIVRAKMCASPLKITTCVASYISDGKYRHTTLDQNTAGTRTMRW